jgi:hypothetical protein
MLLVNLSISNERIPMQRGRARTRPNSALENESDSTLPGDAPRAPLPRSLVRKLAAAPSYRLSHRLLGTGPGRSPDHVFYRPKRIETRAKSLLKT